MELADTGACGLAGRGDVAAVAGRDRVARRRRLAALHPAPRLPGPLDTAVRVHPSPSPPAPGPASGPPAACTTVVSSLSAAGAAVVSAAPGATVCLADGTYVKLTLDARKAGEVVVRAQHPGQATLAGASVSGSNLTLARFAVIGDEIRLGAASDHLKVEYNLISGGYFGVNAGLTTEYPSLDDTTIAFNRFVGPFGEDAIRGNTFHDGDGDGDGFLVFGNEFTNVRENGNHSDCFQTSWGGDHLRFARNYLHDNTCQGFFVKDQAITLDGVIVEDNLFLRNNSGCVAPATCNFAPVSLHLFGPETNVEIRRNTMWSADDSMAAALRDPGWGAVTVRDNVFRRLFSDTAAPFGAGYRGSGNLACGQNGQTTEGLWPATGVTRTCSPPFPDPAAGDYRLAGAGVSWAIADQRFGP